MRVDDVVRLAGRGGPVERGLAKEGEALGIVRIIALRRAVEKLAIEVRCVPDEDRPQALVLHRVDLGIVNLASERDANVACRVPDTDTSIARNHQVDGVPETHQRFRQSPEHVGQSSRFCKGLRLGADHQNPHYLL